VIPFVIPGRAKREPGITTAVSMDSGPAPSGASRNDTSNFCVHRQLRTPVNDYDALRDYLKKQTRPEFVLRFDEIEQIIDAALPRAAHRASWWETLRSPQEKMPQREACLAGGYIATRLADGKSVRFKRVK
jgi:hypothetical protein